LTNQYPFVLRVCQ